MFRSGKMRDVVECRKPQPNSVISLVIRNSKKYLSKK